MKKSNGNVLRPSTRYLRSTHLERDFHDSKALHGYVLTDAAITSIGRIAEGLDVHSGQRAWRIIGDYGSGKSSFALLLAHWLAGHTEKFPRTISSQLSYKSYNVKKPNLVPILITGSRESISTTIARGVKGALGWLYPSGFGRGPNKITALLKEESLNDEQVIELVTLVRDRIINDNKGSGLVLVIDELGKNLEYAASNPNDNDVYVMQRLAEEASRSSDKPVFIINILHQGFSAYASALGLSSQKEWEKVSGRYGEIVFHHPMEQTAILVADALNSSGLDLSPKQKTASRKSMRNAIELGWYGPSVSERHFIEYGPRLYPLDSFLLPVMARILHKFGQNQRSVFGFLFGNEPHGLNAFLSVTDNVPYCLCDLYDYISSNLGHFLATSPQSQHWNIIESVVSSSVAKNELELKIIKTIGVMNLLNATDIVPTAELVSLCLTGKENQSTILNAINRLKSKKGKRILFDRGFAGGLCLWPHISVDLQSTYDRALTEIGPISDSLEFLRGYLDKKYLVANRHYIKTGNLRYFSIAYCRPEDLEKPDEFVTSLTDGAVLVPLCMNRSQVNKAIRLVLELKVYKKLKTCMVAIPKPLNQCNALIREVLIWDWVVANTPELNGDRYARETVSRQRYQARSQLENAIQQTIGLDNVGGSLHLKCFWQGKQLAIKTRRELLTGLSNICDSVYSKSPRVLHELINRRMLSSAAAAARMRLIERVFEFPQEPLLGMNPDKKPPEMSMYLSIFQKGGLHIEQDGKWFLQIPKGCDDKLHLSQAFTYMEKLLVSNSDEKVNAKYLLDRIKLPPYGVNDGLAPLLLAIFYAIHKRTIAFYENGTFIGDVTGVEFLRLTKRPEMFEFQYCNIEGLRTDVFIKLASLMTVSVENIEQLDILDIVRPLCVFAGNLPQYVHKTKRLSESTMAVREALLDATEPVKLLFEALPTACLCNPIDEHSTHKNNVKFVDQLEKSIHELRTAYAALRNNIKKAILKNYNLNGSKSSYRKAISSRSASLSIAVAEPKLKAFCFRLKDDTLPEGEWLDSIASLVSSKPPDKWLDQDEDVFYERLAEYVTRFLRTETVAFDQNVVKGSEAFRLCVTQASGEEKKQIISIDETDHKKVLQIQNKIEKLLEGHGDVGLVAASRALWRNLKG